MSDDLQYEDFDDVLRSREDELEPIDLDALDDEIEPQAAEPILEAIDLDALDDDIEPVEQQDKATETILEAISELDDEIEDQSAEKIEEPEIIQEAAPVDTAQEVVETAPEIIEVESEVVEAAAEVVVSEAVVEPEAVAEPEAVVEAETVEPEKAPPKKRKRKPKVEEAAAAEVETPADESPQEAVVEAKAPVDETPQETALLYRVMIPLPDQLAGTVLDLRKTGKIIEMPPPGIDLAAAFHAADLAPVQEALSTWARNHLPLQLEITAVLAEVIGARQFVAAWMLQPEEELHDAQRDLMRALESFISPLPDAPAAFHVRVTIGDHVTPKPFPSLIGMMQRDFEPFVWDAETVSLIRFGQAKEANQWETVESFR